MKLTICGASMFQILEYILSHFSAAKKFSENVLIIKEKKE